ncbi:MAG: hypothetical protein ACLR3C_06670 [Eggerthella lenta]
MEKLPPIEKVYEAWSAVADGRVALHPDERRAAIASSNGAKTYTVAWNETARRTRRTTTPRTGKAMLATSSPCSCCKAGFRSTALQPTGSRRWTTDLNERCKRDYAAAVRAVVDERSLDAVRVEAAARKAFDALGARHRRQTGVGQTAEVPEGVRKNLIERGRVSRCALVSMFQSVAFQAASRAVMHELEADDASDEADDEQHLRHRDRLGSREHAVGDREGGAEPTQTAHAVPAGSVLTA